MQAFNGFPYITLPQESVDATAWELPSGKPLGPWVEGWAPGTDLSITCTVSLDADEVRKICGLSADAGLALVPTWRASGTTLRGRGAVHSLPAGEGGRMSYKLALVGPGDEIGGRLEVRTVLALGRTGTHASALSAVRPGSILWMRQDFTDLEGGPSAFPIRLVPFSGISGWSPEALWVLEWNPSLVELFSPFSKEVRLFINAEHPAFGGAERSQGPSEESIRSIIFHEIAKDMALAAVLRAEEIEAEEFPAGSVGQVISNLLSTTFQGMRPTQVAARRRSNPGWFSTRMQASTNLLRTSVIP